MTHRLTAVTFLGLLGVAAADSKAPPHEVTDLAKQVTGTWKCTGTAWMPDGKQFDLVGKVRSKADLDKFWIHDTFDLKAMRGKVPYKLESFTTYDASAQMWRRVVVTNLGGQMIGSSDGLTDGKAMFQLDATGALGSMKLRETIDTTVPNTLRMTTERSLDQGKTWGRDNELVCKR